MTIKFIEWIRIRANQMRTDTLNFSGREISFGFWTCLWCGVDKKTSHTTIGSKTKKSFNCFYVWLRVGIFESIWFHDFNIFFFFICHLQLHNMKGFIVTNNRLLYRFFVSFWLLGVCCLLTSLASGKKWSLK